MYFFRVKYTGDNFVRFSGDASEFAKKQGKISVVQIKFILLKKIEINMSKKMNMFLALLM